MFRMPYLVAEVQLTALLQLANFIVALTTPILISTSSFSVYFFFGGCTLVATVMIALFMQETRGHSLESLEQRYLENSARSTGRWARDGFKLRRIHVAQIA
jgi:hypothetical protein